MALKTYQVGADFERRVRGHFEKLGYLMVRSAGSKGIVDLMGIILNGSSIVIQCRTRGNLSKEERSELVTMKYKYGCRAILAYKDEHKMEFEEL